MSAKAKVKLHKLLPEHYLKLQRTKIATPRKIIVPKNLDSFLVSREASAISGSPVRAGGGVVLGIT